MEWVPELIVRLLTGRNVKQFLHVIAWLTLASILSYVSRRFIAAAVLAREAEEPAAHLLVLALFLDLLALGILARLLLAWIRDTRARRSARRVENATSTISQLRSTNRLFAEDSPLVGANWASADLFQIDLSSANLCRMGLESANLREANLKHANLRSARLEHADLRACDLRHAILCYARLQGADLRDAQLDDAELSAADLSGARLAGASLHSAHFDENTILPDGCKWKSTTNWERFGVTL